MKVYGISIAVWIFATIGAIRIAFLLLDAAIKGWRTLGKTDEDTEPAPEPEPLEPGEAARLAQRALSDLAHKFAWHHPYGPFRYGEWRSWATKTLGAGNIDVQPVTQRCDACQSDRCVRATLQQPTDGFPTPTPLASAYVCRQCANVTTGVTPFVRPRRHTGQREGR